jgi:hypothetical protein
MSFIFGTSFCILVVDLMAFCLMKNLNAETNKKITETPMKVVKTEDEMPVYGNTDENAIYRK